MIYSVHSEITVSIVAAFTDDPAAGSPTGVVLDAGDWSTDTMQQIANQSGCSHTAFARELGQGAVNIRFITATGDIKNCAHATIAAHYLRAMRMGSVGDMILKQHTLSGVQDVEVRRQDRALSVYFRQDAIQFTPVSPDIITELLGALKLSPSALDRRYSVTLASPGANRFLVGLNDVSIINGLQPDFSALKALCVRFAGIGCFVFAMQSPTEVVARVFAPNIGVDEDVINGNSSGCLGAYLLRFEKEVTELNLHVHQGQNFNRPGTVMVNARRGESGIETWVGGRAAYVSEQVVHVKVS